MKTPALLTATAVALLAVALPLHAQTNVFMQTYDPNQPDSARKSWEHRAETTLLANDSLAVVELRAATGRSVALAHIASTKANDSQVRELAQLIEKEGRKNIASLLKVTSTLKQDATGRGMDKESVNVPEAIGAVAFYSRDTVPVYRQVEGNVYVRDTTTIFRRRAVAVVPFQVRLKQHQADSVKAVQRQKATIDKLTNMSGERFDEAYLDAQIAFARWRIDHIHDRIVKLTWNDDLRTIVDDMQVELGIHLRRALDLQPTVNVATQE